MSNPKNPPAYPSLNNVVIGDTMTSGHPGMTLRDWFAGQALGAVIEVCRYDTPKEGETLAELFARKSFNVADALLIERERGE